MKQNNTTTIFYDGLCHLCSREIDGYRNIDKDGRLAFVDITAPDFDAPKEGFDPDEVQKVMHVRRADGSVVKGVDAFIAIWRALDRFKLLTFLAETQPSRCAFQLGYSCFAKIRPLLPKKACEIPSDRS